MAIGKDLLRWGAEAVVCAVAPVAAPSIIFSESAAMAMRVAVRSAGGDDDSTKQAETTARGILGAGRFLDRLLGGD